jgi:two-component system phosphate regulon response regulator PhoB
MALAPPALTVLVVDGDPDARGLIRRTLAADDTVVLEAGDGDAALSTIRAAPVAVVIIDGELPGMTGLDVVRHVRHDRRDLHVIMVSAHGAEHDRVAALLTGADDVVAKPFSPSELAARVVAARRRLAPRPPSEVQLGPLRIDPVARVVDIEGQRLGLTRREYELLLHLATHPGTAFTRDELLRDVWSSSAAWQSTATVTEHIRRLRSKLQCHGDARWIGSVRGVGYRFDPPS